MERGGCSHNCPPHPRALSRNSLGATQNIVFFPGVMTAEMELPGSSTCWAHLAPPQLEQGMAAEGPEVALFKETSGVLGVSTLSPEGPLSLEPSPRLEDSLAP